MGLRAKCCAHAASRSKTAHVDRLPLLQEAEGTFELCFTDGLGVLISLLY